MLWIIFGSVGTGLAAGFLGWIPPAVQPYFDQLITCGVCLLVFSVGVDIGQNRRVWHHMKALGARAFFLPASVAAGTLLGSGVACLFIPIGFREALAVGAGFGWYSFAGVFLTKLSGAELGALAFLSNMLRELLAILLIPFLARYVGPFSAIAPGGATTMDTTLPLINRFTDSHGALLALINGFVLTLLAPVLMSFLMRY